MKELEVVEISEEEKEEYYKRINLDDNIFKLSAMREDSVKFSKFMLGLGVRDYQMKLFNLIDEFPKLAVVKGRQIGFSTAIALYCLWFAWFNKHPSGIHNNTKIGIISKDDDAAKKVLQMIKDFMYQGDSHMSNFLRDKFVTGPDGKKERVKNNNLFSCKIDQSNVDVLKIKTGNGKSSAISSIHSFPPTGKARGHSFDLVFVDEAAFLNCPNPSNYFNTVIMPTISETNGKIVVSSTPNGYSGLFYDLIDPDNKNSNNLFERYSFPYTVRDDDNYLKEVGYLKTKLNLSEFMQEYCCDFTQNDISFFESKKIKEMFDENISNINMDNHEWICGIDYGMTEARTVVTLTTEIEGVITRGYFKEFEAGWNNNNLIPFLENLKDRFRINKFIVDNCLEENTEIIMNDGSRKKIKNVNIGDMVLSWNKETKKFEPKRVYDKSNSGILKGNKIKFRNGTSVIASDGHKWLAHSRTGKKIYGKYTKDLDKTKDVIPSLLKLNLPTISNSFNESDLYILGMYIAEGHNRDYGKSKKTYFISQLKPDSCKRIQEHLNKSSVIKWQKNTNGFYLSDAGKLSRLLDMVNQYSYNKNIPNEVLHYEEDKLNALWEGLIDGDGHIAPEHKDKRGYKVSRREEYYTSSPELNQDIKMLARLIGKPMYSRERVHSGFDSKRVQYEPVWCEKSHYCNQTFNDTVSKTSIVSIEDSDQVQMYDISVEDNHSFVLADSGVVTQNCPQGDSYNKKMVEMGWNVELFDFHTQKIEGFCSLRSKINYGLVKMIYDKDTEQQFLEMQQEESKMGKLMIHKPRYGRDDICDSMVMSALPFLNNNKAKIGVYLV